MPFMACAVYAQGYLSHLDIYVYALICSQSSAHYTHREMPGLGVGKYMFKKETIRKKVPSVCFDLNETFCLKIPL